MLTETVVLQLALHPSQPKLHHHKYQPESRQPRIYKPTPDQFAPSQARRLHVPRALRTVPHQNVEDHQGILPPSKSRPGLSASLFLARHTHHRNQAPELPRLRSQMWSCRMLTMRSSLHLQPHLSCLKLHRPMPRPLSRSHPLHPAHLRSHLKVTLSMRLRRMICFRVLAWPKTG